MIHVLEVLEGGKVVVDAGERYRVVAQSAGVIGELLEKYEADAVARTFAENNPGLIAHVICYAVLFQSISSCFEI